MDITKKTLLITGGVFLLFVAAGAWAAMQPRGQWPIENGQNRTVLLHFGMFVRPDANNPIQPPERFIGYHVGTDFEITPDEANTVVKVYAACSGKIRYSGFATGYGGLLITDCTIDNQPVTVIYGHLELASLPSGTGSVIQGQQVAVLGAAHSHDTDGNRKHLHFGIHKGTELDTLGYVQDEKDLANYIDPQNVLPIPFESKK